MTRICLQCEHSFEPNRPHQVFDSEECRYQGWVEKEVLAAQGGPQRVEPHPLAAARAQQEESETNKRFGLLIRQAIIDRLKTVGTCHADDLEDLYPANELERKRCRRLAGAQFGSLASPHGDGPLIREKERRKSSIPERKGAKSGVYQFTKAGWDRWGIAGVEGDRSRGLDVASAGLGHSLDSGDSGLTGPGDSSAGQLPGKRDQGRPEDPPSSASAASPEPLSLLPEPDPKAWAA